MPGVAASLVGLVDIAAAQHRRAGHPRGRERHRPGTWRPRHRGACRAGENAALAARLCRIPRAPNANLDQDPPSRTTTRRALRPFATPPFAGVVPRERGRGIFFSPARDSPRPGAEGGSLSRACLFCESAPAHQPTKPSWRGRKKDAEGALDSETRRRTMRGTQTTGHYRARQATQIETQTQTHPGGSEPRLIRSAIRPRLPAPFQFLH